MMNNTYKELRNIIEQIQEKDIYNILNETVNFSEKPEILFYGKSFLTIYGYLEIRNKTFYFEIRINKTDYEEDYTISVKVGKMVIVKKIEKVL